ncbi:MAG: T9SS type A sorting domain-containing protein [Candidatus Eisenbacteria bacterium]|nr:T9SS type A sorting domain-containing protein [Candidatus Eisenbacteria bacterium]
MPCGLSVERHRWYTPGRIGNSLWTVDGVLACGAGEYQTYPEIVTDGHHAAIIACADERGYGMQDYCAQRIAYDGRLMWAQDGVPICTASGIQDYLAMVPGGSDGAHFVWEDYRTAGSSGVDICGQRVASDGTPDWFANGARICGAADDQRWPDIVTDGDGGVVLAWSDGGKAISAAPYGQRFVRLVQDAGSGAILAWQDFRSNESWDIYAQSTEFLPSAVEEVVPGPGSRFGSPDLSDDCFPNPFRALVSIPYRLPDAERVFLRVYDSTGRLIRTIEGESPEAGGSVFLWDGRDANGQEARSGTYFCRLKEGGREKIHKVIKVR